MSKKTMLSHRIRVGEEMVSKAGDLVDELTEEFQKTVMLAGSEEAARSLRPLLARQLDDAVRDLHTLEAYLEKLLALKKWRSPPA